MENKIKKYVIGLDIGIGSVGWAVVNMDTDPKRIEDFGVEIFESGETDALGKSRTSQERRAFRAGRRLVRRRSYRKARLKYYLEQHNLLRPNELQEYYENGKNNMVALRVKGLDEKLTMPELAACLIHISNHRGYLDFYESDRDDPGSAEEKEDKQGLQQFEALMKSGNYRSVAELYLKHPEFGMEGSERRRYRNRNGYTKLLPKREEIQDEAERILDKQSEFYPQLQDHASKIINIIFAQRPFEYGPGKKDDVHRQYKGFLDTVGKCSYFPDENRGFRNTLISDEYALVNVLSQYRYVNSDGELMLSGEIARELLETANENAGINKTTVNKILKKYKYTLMNGDSAANDFPKAIKFMKDIKKVLDVYGGFDWKEISSVENALDTNSFLNRLGECMSKNITPRLRRRQLDRIPELNKHPKKTELIKTLCRVKCSGTSMVSYKYMQGAIQAFLEGDVYGRYQDKQNEEISKEHSHKKYEKLPPFNKDFEFYKNPVVMRSINETRKILNHIIERYGSPYEINLEVGKDLNKSYLNRQKEQNLQKANEKENKAALEKVASLLGVDISMVTSAQMERFILGEQQNWQCLYSGKPIDPQVALKNTDKLFEIDHIIPYSLILDNTKNNKALVYAKENQEKRQKTPLEYMKSAEQQKEFKARINLLYKQRKISAKKYEYLRTASVADAMADGILGGWKSRNLNDTRYISKFLTGYLKNNLKFSSEHLSNVYAVRGAITSQMRQLWLNKYTWGCRDKGKLKEVTYLDHAADAVVIANCIPVYIEIDMMYQRLRRIVRDNDGKINDEYKNTLERAVEHISHNYRMSEEQVRSYLNRASQKVVLDKDGNKVKGSYIPTLVPRLWEEVSIRFADYDMNNYFKEQYEYALWKKKKEEADKNGYTMPDFVASPKDSAEAIAAQFRKDVSGRYNDKAFEDALQMPFTVHKSSRKYSGKITDSKPVRVVEYEGKEVKLDRKNMDKLTAKDLEHLYMCDADIQKSLEDELAKNGKIITDANGFFTTQKGTKIRRVTVMSAAKRTLKKVIDTEHPEKNFTLLTDTSYFCVEIYKNEKGETRTCGIAYSDLKKENGKLYLKETYQYPSDYAQHTMYLFPYDYIKVYDKNNNIKMSGYYKAVFNINDNMFYRLKGNTPCGKRDYFTVSKGDSIEKYEVDLLGRLGGKIQCGGPLLSVREKK